jgi:hypothetical protein
MKIKGLYIYGIIPNYYSSELFRELDTLKVLSIPFGKISAIVAESTIVDYTKLGTGPLAKLLLSHQKTIESVMGLGFNTIIPMQLGTFATNPSQVKKILEKGYDLILQTFERISGFIEIDVVATWADFSKIIEEIANDPQVVAMKTKIQQNEDITRADQMEIGFLVKKLLDKKRNDLSVHIFRSLEPLCQSARQHELLNDQMVSNTAFMVNQQQQILIEKSLNELDSELNGQINFKLVGPLPCYSFYTMEARLLKFEDLLHAKEEIETGDIISEKTIRQAYLKKVKQFHPDQNPDDEGRERFNQVQQAYKTLLSYVQAQNADSQEDPIEISHAKFDNDFYIIKIKD